MLSYVNDQEVLEEDIDTEAYSSLINSEVLSENGELLGQVRDFKLDTRDGKVLSLIIASMLLEYPKFQVKLSAVMNFLLMKLSVLVKFPLLDISKN